MMLPVSFDTSCRAIQTRNNPTNYTHTTHTHNTHTHTYTSHRLRMLCLAVLITLQPALGRRNGNNRRRKTAAHRVQGGGGERRRQGVGQRREFLCVAGFPFQFYDLRPCPRRTYEKVHRPRSV